MEESAAVRAADQFLKDVWTGEPPTVSRLIELLDALIASYHLTTEAIAPEATTDPPNRDWKAVYDQTAKRFPNLGLYPIADPLAEGAGTLMMGDAIDDIADITSDLRDVVWVAENHGAKCADTHFRQLYVHWGTHARELLLLLHAKQTWQPFDHS
ncbi:hypothetical protein EI983_00610 [Roseovarius faecimaris]|uniref:DUF5063 domain-containing protein n=1 Tax=Roseovarius faecimaris TaxID=2494550 RepID=A0A6I6IIV7_9RHOB|nr:hypothetical protein [Roseovarius faecimaris]QGX96860.1 hypothetical protein EI983_00610 [Roseovarius faecimaris]